MKKTGIISMLIMIFCIALFCGAAAAEEFTGLNDYQTWAVNTGYPQGYLVPTGINGINQDYFHSFPGAAGYDSGRIVIGDSRSCQLGIFQQRTGGADYAVFAVWGGHYVPGTGTSIMTDQLLSEVEQCFQEQIRTNGSSTVFFFATINDYDYLYNYNSGYISAAISSAETIASMSYTYEGSTYYPEVILIGFDGIGADSGFSPDVFNRYVDPYNRELYDDAANSAVLKNTAPYYTTVPQITGGNTTFISDGIHYSDAVLQEIAGYMDSFGR